MTKQPPSTSPDAQHDYGTPSPALLQRADRGYARFLATDHLGRKTPSSQDQMARRHTVVHAPDRDVEAGHPLDRAAHVQLLKTVLAWHGEPGLPADDYRQIARQLTGAARVVADDVRATADRLPTEHAARLLAEYVLEQSTAALQAPIEGTARCVRTRARCVRELYERLDRLVGIASQSAKGL
ncbi:restriction endonuclease [Streptomyces sp. NPDC093097]|uniref:restriction endonuclease n=1 Tax=Streptomyces sp. NPDC093097 TaxID=3366027 RepID=UPI00381AC67E